MKAPAGFAVERSGRLTLVGRVRDRSEIRRLGLDVPSGWDTLLSGAPRGRGRGGIARVEVAGGGRWVLKQMRRGGAVSSLWRDRFLGTKRLLRNLSVPLTALERGIPTAAPVALLLLEGPRGLYRAWLASEEIAGAADLGERLAAPVPPTRDELAEALGAVRRMHDAGLEHPDLNLGNLLLRATKAGAPEAFVVDLDRAVLHDRPLAFGARLSALKRLERSHLKSFATEPSSWYALYAGGDADLARRLEQRSSAGRALLVLHRMGWRIRGKGRSR